MRTIWLVLLLLAGRALQAEEPQFVMRDFYQDHVRESKVQRSVVLYDGYLTQEYAAYLGLEKHVPTMLCMWHRESGFDSSAIGSDKKSFGVAQTLMSKKRHWRRFWIARGIKLPPASDPKFQVAAGVAEFYECLKLSKGNEWDAVRRYNGSGRMARLYAKRVFRSREVIFGLKPPKKKSRPR